MKSMIETMREEEIREEMKRLTKREEDKIKTIESIKKIV